MVSHQVIRASEQESEREGEGRRERGEGRGVIGEYQASGIIISALGSFQFKTLYCHGTHMLTSPMQVK